MINKFILAAYKCAIFKIKLPYYVSFVCGCEMKTLCQKMLKFCIFLSLYQTCKGTDFENVSKFTGG